MAIAALPLVAQYADPEEAIKTLEAAAAEARSFTHKIAHSAALTEKEQYQGWAPLLLIMYRAWQTVIGPQVAFTIEAQIGLADVLNTFGAHIDTAGLRKVLENVNKSIGYNPQVKTPSLGQTVAVVGNPIPPLAYW